MLARLDALFAGRSPGVVSAFACALACALALVDHWTGFELSFSIFYLAPIALASWYGGARAGALLCALCVVLWSTVDYTSGHVYSVAAIRYWNASVRLGFFVVSSSLLVSLRRHLAIERQLARHDGLTGVLNARAFREASGAHFELAARHRRAIVLGYVDLDNFKSVNDRLGHAAGDEVLVGVATAMQSRLRATDLLGRLGGDEFAILLPDTDASGARALFDELARTLGDLFSARDWPVGASFGVAVFESVPETADAALRCADELMYGVKESGKNGVALRRFAGTEALAS